MLYIKNLLNQFSDGIYATALKKADSCEVDASVLEKVFQIRDSVSTIRILLDELEKLL